MKFNQSNQTQSVETFFWAAVLVMLAACNAIYFTAWASVVLQAASFGMGLLTGCALFVAYKIVKPLVKTSVKFGA